MDLIIERVSSCSVSHSSPNICRVQLEYIILSINNKCSEIYEGKMDTKRCQRIAKRLYLCLNNWSELISEHGGGADQREALDIAYMLMRELAHPERPSILRTDCNRDASPEKVSEVRPKDLRPAHPSLRDELANALDAAQGTLCVRMDLADGRVLRITPPDGGTGLVGGSRGGVDLSASQMDCSATIRDYFLLNESIQSISSDEDVLTATQVPAIGTSSNGSPLSGARGRFASSARAVKKLMGQDLWQDPWVGFGRGNPVPKKAELPLTPAVRKMTVRDPDLSSSAVRKSPYFADAEESSPNESFEEGPDSV